MKPSDQKQRVASRNQEFCSAKILIFLQTLPSFDFRDNKYFLDAQTSVQTLFKRAESGPFLDQVCGLLWEQWMCIAHYTHLFIMRKHPLIHISFSHPVKICPEAVLSEDENLVNLEEQREFLKLCNRYFILSQIVCSINIKQGGQLPFRPPMSHLNIFTLHAFLE